MIQYKKQLISFAMIGMTLIIAIFHIFIFQMDFTMSLSLLFYGGSIGWMARSIAGQHLYRRVR